MLLDFFFVCFRLVQILFLFFTILKLLLNNIKPWNVIKHIVLKSTEKEIICFKEILSQPIALFTVLAVQEKQSQKLNFSSGSKKKNP